MLLRLTPCLVPRGEQISMKPRIGPVEIVRCFYPLIFPSSRTLSFGQLTLTFCFPNVRG